MKKSLIYLVFAVFSVVFTTTSVSGVEADKIFPAPPDKSMFYGKTFRFSGLAGGTYYDRNLGQFVYRDFVPLAAFYSGKGLAQLTVRLTDDQGLNFSYLKDNLGRPLEIFGSSTKKTVYLNAAGAAFNLREYHPDITVEILSTEDIWVMNPVVFSTVGFGQTPEAAAENGWQKFGFSVPTFVDRNFVVIPYSIFWRNVSAFPNGWTTKVSLRNRGQQSISFRLHLWPDYNNRYDTEKCGSETIAGPSPIDLWLAPGGKIDISTHDFLRETLTSSHTMEGAWGMEFQRYHPFLEKRVGMEDLEVVAEVIPLTGGKRVCAPKLHYEQ